ncbi:MAG: SHOCT domain-containing protein, partial [Proteobacteria bacterium]|nr:SHOCT domain-containing protein [Pseudomonadota bacterium]
PEQKTPLDILKESYARGDLSRDEYLQKRDDLLEK